MPTNKEIDKEQAERYYDLLMLLEAKGKKREWLLAQQINKTRAAMTKETITWVEQQVKNTMDTDL